MAYPMQLTRDGQNILAKGLVGKEIHFSKVAYGAGDFDYDTESVLDMTELKDLRLDLPIVDKKIIGDGTVTIVALLRNFDLEEGFPAKEIGVYAIEPDTGEEKLYAYRNCGEEYNFIPAKTGFVVKNARFGYVVEIRDAKRVTFEINFAFAYVSVEDFEAHINSAEPHPNTPTHFDDVENFDCFWVTDSDNDLHKISVDEVKKILGVDSTDEKISDKLADDEISESVSAEEIGLILDDFAKNFVTENVSRETFEPEKLSEYVEVRSEIGLAEPNILQIENFNPATLIDATKIKITSCAKGSNLISAEAAEGLNIGAEYFLSDGVNCETIKIINIVNATSRLEVSGANFFLTLEENLLNSYSLDEVFLLRTNVSRETKISGNLPLQKRFWRGGDVFSGIAANVAHYTKLNFDSDNQAAFKISGDGFLSKGKFTLA